MGKRVRKRKPFDAVSFTNDIGQVINVGDPVIAITKSTGSVGTYVGRYVGVRKTGHKDRDGVEEVNVLVETDHEHEVWVHNTNPDLTFDWDTDVPGLPDPVRPSYSLSDYGYTGPLNNWYGRRSAEQEQQYQAAYAAQRKAHADYNQAWQDHMLAREAYKHANYHKVVKPYIVQRTLYRNRVYLTKTGLAELKRLP